MHVTPPSAEVTLLDFSESNPLCSTRGGSFPILHPPPAGYWNEIRGGSASDLKEERERERKLESIRHIPLDKVELSSLGVGARLA